MTYISYICKQCVEEGKVPDKSRDPPGGIRTKVRDIILIGASMQCQLDCGHVYLIYHHSLGATERYLEKKEVKSMISGPINEIAEVIAESWKHGIAGDQTQKSIEELDVDLDIFYAWINKWSIKKLIRENLLLRYAMKEVK